MKLLRSLIVTTAFALPFAVTVAELPAVAAEEAVKPLAPGDTLQALHLVDQHGKPAPVDAETRLILFVRDMDGGSHLRVALSSGGAAMLSAAHAVYVSDLSRMPGLVRKMMALPALRRRDYPVLLDEDGAQTARFPYKVGQVTLLRLDAGRIVSIGFASQAYEIENELKKPVVAASSGG